MREIGLARRRLEEIFECERPFTSCEITWLLELSLKEPGTARGLYVRRYPVFKVFTLKHE